MVLTGTHHGELVGIPPTGKSVEFGGTDIIRVEDGKVAEHWGTTDTMSLMQQIGAVAVSLNEADARWWPERRSQRDASARRVACSRRAETTQARQLKAVHVLRDARTAVRTLNNLTGFHVVSAAP